MPNPTLTTVWPTLNKQDHLDAYLDQLRRFEFNVCRAVVEETVYLTFDEWLDFKENLLTDRLWLAGKGGHDARGVRSVILVVRPGETQSESVGLYVDPQGSDYARYVGFFLSRDREPNIVTNPPGLLTLRDAMGTTLNGLTMSQRILNEVAAGL